MLPNRYHFREAEPRLARLWADANTYAFDPAGSGPIYTIDTPPPTVSGTLHIGHCFSYTQTDVIARFQRMRGRRVLYPMGFDDNGLPTERFVEKTIKRKATEMDRAEFLAQCRSLTQETEDGFESLLRRLSLSVDWDYRYSTLSPEAQRTSQASFIQLYQAGRAYDQVAPTLWCPDCRTAIAQAEQDDQMLPTLFTTFAFHLPDGQALPIATTRPELLAACVAIFVHPQDQRYASLLGLTARIASKAFSQQETIEVPILADELVDPAKGSGAVMCCTFGDSTDVRWWRTHQLPLRAAIDRAGRMTALAGPLAGLPTAAARKLILQNLAEQGLILHQETIEHTIGVHERCGTPVEYLQTRQWFIRVLDQKERLIEIGRQIRWNPEYMRIRYEHWVENLQWDWCISRQRFLGVPFPAWTCRACGELLLAEQDELPIDPRQTNPGRACRCGAMDFEPEMDVMDTWATSSCTPLLIGRWLDDPAWFRQHFPASLRAQAHDIIRTWAFYTIVKALYHCDAVPWKEIMLSGHGLSSERTKVSKSKGNGSLDPTTVIEQESADALRYWATSVKPGQDTPFSPESIANGRRLVTKLWNACRFAEGRLHDLDASTLSTIPAGMLPTDHWLLARLAQTITFATRELEQGDYAAARMEVERFFWSDLCDNYLELVKSRLYQDEGDGRRAAQWTLYHALLGVLKLLAPYLPFITEELYLGLFQSWDGAASIHTSAWPTAPADWLDPQAEREGQLLLEILRSVRRQKAELGISVGGPLESLRITTSAASLPMLQAASSDLQSVTRTRYIEFIVVSEPHEEPLSQTLVELTLPPIHSM
ncbi:valine--tRNA ligase [Dictyobacter aurantiacus]|uniref:Valine--tRNA ligase n=1 Tax=Dictyobacter aurantiacus TaxID=1936993 RepID=A0A401ZJ59_9CHLR|nr:valine--tRNA ligase [Dictyobacter aurantiacus]GCE06864.1 valine--tRNA ligase [Dictyobacter aurantiacus]